MNWLRVKIALILLLVFFGAAWAYSAIADGPQTTTRIQIGCPAICQPTPARH